jgi:DNA polymerase III epsilon subunit family exonuclease
VAHVRLEQALHELDFVAFDVETTGLNASLERVVELSAVRFRLGAARSTFDELVDPGVPIPPAAARVNGIRDEDVSGKPGIGPVLRRFLEFAQDAVLLAHNAEFDVGFLVHEAARHDIGLPYAPVLDSVELSRRVRPDLPSHKLEALSRALGCPAQTYHRALADADTLSSCFERLLETLYPEAERASSVTLAQLIDDSAPALSFGAPGRLRMWVPHLAALDLALQRQSNVTMVYRPTEGAAGAAREQAMDVRPKGYVRRPGVTMLVADLVRDGQERSFRLDWITRCHLAQASLF